MPLLGDVSLELVQRIEHRLDGGFVATRIAGLEGELQQRVGRPSHRIDIVGVLAGEGAADDLGKLQQAATGGEETTFSSDITTALDLQKVVVDSIHAEQLAGYPDRFRYSLTVVESPPLPAPAQVDAFGGLDEFGVGDLGFDTSLVDDLANEASKVADVVDGALDALDELKDLASLGELGQLGDLLGPMSRQVTQVGTIGKSFGESAAKTKDDLGE